jgi:hypothetical protein
MYKHLLFLIFSFLSLNLFGQQDPSHKINVGIEQDVLPYITGGYFAGIWAGKDHVRARLVTAKVNKPDFIIKDGFTNNKVKAFALLLDYFPKTEWKGWWAGAGLVYWRNSIQTDQKINTAHYKDWLLNGSIGYNYKLSKKLYVSPWAGLHIKIGGDKNVAVDNKIFKPSLLNPEASIKFGIYL